MNFVYSFNKIFLTSINVTDNIKPYIIIPINGVSPSFPGFSCAKYFPNNPLTTG